MPIITVITVNQNNAPGLALTIESVVDQVYNDYEYIIIDGGSLDGSVDIINKYAEKIYYWISEPDSGIYGAMNKGILQANGEYLLFLNSGDILADDYVLEKVINSNLNEDIIYGDIIISDGGRKSVQKFPERIDYAYMFSNSIGHPGTFIKKELFNSIGLYNENLRIVSDWEFFIKAIIKNKVSCRHLDFPVSVFSLGGNSSSSANSGKIRSERELVLRGNFPPFNVDFHYYPNLFDSKVAALYNLFSKNALTYFILKRLVQLLSRLKRVISDFVGFVIMMYRRLLELILPTKYKNPRSVPVIINNFNRLTYLKMMLSWLDKKGFNNIYIIDNCSTYPPLLDFYRDECKHKVFRLTENKGHLAFWETNIYKEFINDFYIYTDPDIIPVEECPDDLMEYFMKQLRRHPKICKIGFSLKIDDLPDYYSKKEEVLKWEIQNFRNEIEPGLFYASIDTTFALYRPREKGDWKLKALRTGFPYQARHLPWYEDDSILSEEEQFYSKSKLPNVGHWI